uniref:Uncharacterized protein n=1 Tax=Favella ehrenbergii TaxID=182087 RepID=A0A7S3I139_9SPIT|mmetsp:Transcript_27138/g.33729  ORF Transcript_27138/g.33729 Transcript_27138/m.33729 type:complete len:100 (+) Transcript_27138:2483-2782(+)
MANYDPGELNNCATAEEIDPLSHALIRCPKLLSVDLEHAIGKLAFTQSYERCLEQAMAERSSQADDSEPFQTSLMKVSHLSSLYGQMEPADQILRFQII